VIKFITYREPNENGLLCYYILQKAFPHYRAILSKGKLEDALVSMPVFGYNLHLNFNGCIRGNILPSYQDAIKEIEFTMMEMSDWFYKNRILTEPKKYEKFRHDYISAKSINSTS